MRYGPNVLTLLLITLLCFNTFSPCGDLDYTWQIRTGGLIEPFHNLRPPEAFSYTIAGDNIPDFEWLYDYGLYHIWQLFGSGGIKFLKNVLVITPLVLLGRRLARAGLRSYAVTTAILLAIFVLAEAWNLRPLYVTTIGLLLVSGWLHDHCHGHAPLPWYLPIVMLLWANLHPGVIAGQGLLAGAIGWEWINRGLAINPRLATRQCLRLTLLGGLGIAATFISPNPIERMLYPFSPNVSHAAQRFFVEMQPSYQLLMRTYPSVWVVYILAAVVACTWVTRFRHYRLWEIAFLCALAGLANLAARSLQDWLYGLLSVGLPHVGLWIRDRAMARKRGVLFRIDRFCRHVLETPWFRMQPVWIAGAIGVMAVVCLMPASKRLPVVEPYACPKKALDFMEREKIHGNIFGPPDFGSYVVWRLWPSARCYVDTRGFFFPGELIEDSHLMPQMLPGWQERLKRVLDDRTDYLLLETTGARGMLWQTLQAHLTPIYLDDKTVLLAAEDVKQAAARHALENTP